MEKFLDVLNEVLLKDERLRASDGKLLKNKAYDLGMQLDEKLIKLLLDNEHTKKHFFKNVNDIYVFDKVEFGWVLENNEFLPDSYTRYKNKIGLSDKNGQLISTKKDVVLVWPYKDCVLKGGQTKEDQKRDEIFYNEILASDEVDRLLYPKVLTNAKRYTKDGEEAITKFNKNDNLIIKGNNLLVLTTLLERYEGKVKCIYIDPPYNTSGATDTFTYNNNFKHTTWLTFMKNRLIYAKKLLREDGFLILTIDHVELFYIGSLMDEIFDIQNRVGIVTVYVNPKGRQHERFFSASTEYMLVYAKNQENARFNKVAIDETVSKSFDLENEDGKKYKLIPFERVRTSTLRKYKPNFYYPIYVSKDLNEITLEKKPDYVEVLPIINGLEYTWKTKPETFQKRNSNKYFQAVKVNKEIKIFHQYEEQQVLKNIWINKKYFPEFHGTNLLKKLFNDNVFSYPKSLYAVIDALKIMTNDDDIILDFFAGSGTTGHAVLELNKEDGGTRQFILCEQMNYIEDVTKERIKKVIDNDEEGCFAFFELKELNELYIRKIEKATKEELKEIWNNILKTGFISQYIDLKNMSLNDEEYKKLSLEEKKKILIEALDKNMLYVNICDMEDEEIGVTEEEKAFTNSFYGRD